MDVPFSTLFSFLLYKGVHFEEAKASEVCLEEESQIQTIFHPWFHVQVTSLSVVKIAS